MSKFDFILEEEPKINEYLYTIDGSYKMNKLFFCKLKRSEQDISIIKNNSIEFIIDNTNEIITNDKIFFFPKDHTFIKEELYSKVIDSYITLYCSVKNEQYSYYFEIYNNESFIFKKIYELIT